MFCKLFASDIDGTLLAHGDKEAEKGAREEFFRLFSERPSHVTLAYATGRSLTLARSAMSQYSLPSPDALICDVGTSLYVQDGEGWTLETSYQELLRAKWNGKTTSDARTALRALKVLELQEEEQQAEFKLSYYAPFDASPEQLTSSVELLLAEVDMKSEIVFSVDPRRKIALIDILPPNTAKDAAVWHLKKFLGVDAEHVIYAGDSGNDLKAFCSGFRAIVVANTEEREKKVVRVWAEREKKEQLIYFSEGECIYGVLEGLRHHGLIDDSGFKD